MKKKQSKADKAFIAKIGTLSVSTGGSKQEPKPIFVPLEKCVQNGKLNIPEIPGYKFAGIVAESVSCPKVALKQKPKKRDNSGEVSFAA